MLGDRLDVAQRPALEEGDGGHVGQGLSGGEIRRAERRRLRAEQVQGAQDLAAQAERKGVGRAESGAQGEG